MDWVLEILIVLHIAGAIVAFGPSFAFPFIGAMGGKEPQHLNFALRLQHRIAHTLVTPLALFEGVTGVALIWRLGIDLFGTYWLLLSIALYLVALAISFGILYPALRVLIPATSGPPPAPPVGGGAPAGPPPHILATAARARMGGMVNLVLVIAIVFLMVVKPF